MPSKTPGAIRREGATQRILDTAEAILGAEGMDALTMQRLAKDLGFTVGATYRYFASKDAIVAALQRRVIASLKTDLDAMLHDDDVEPLVRVALVARTYATLASRRPLHARLLSRMMGDPENVLDASHGTPNLQLALEIGATGVRALAAARTSGALDAGHDTERALVLWASLTGVAQTRKLERWQIPGLSTDALADHLVRALFVGWGAEPKKAKDAITRAARLVSKKTQERS